MEFSKAVQFMKLILKASEIPLEAEVTKPTGTKKYVLKNVIRIYGVDSLEIPMREMLAEHGTRFLYPLDLSTSAISCVAGDTELAWEVDPVSLYHWLCENHVDTHT